MSSDTRMGAKYFPTVNEILVSLSYAVPLSENNMNGDVFEIVHCYSEVSNVRAYEVILFCFHSNMVHILYCQRGVFLAWSVLETEVNFLRKIRNLSVNH